jgi:hypothetical protein
MLFIYGFIQDRFSYMVLISNVTATNYNEVELRIHGSDKRIKQYSENNCPVITSLDSSQSTSDSHTSSIVILWVTVGLHCFTTYSLCFHFLWCTLFYGAIHHSVTLLNWTQLSPLIVLPHINCQSDITCIWYWLTDFAFSCSLSKYRMQNEDLVHSRLELMAGWGRGERKAWAANHLLLMARREEHRKMF